MSSAVARRGGGAAQFIAAAFLGILAYLGWFQVTSYINYAFTNSGLPPILPAIPPPGSPQGNNVAAIIFAASTALIAYFAFRPKTKLSRVSAPMVKK